MFETDPVCHMEVMPETAAARYDYKGKTYYFCNPRCLERFKANPEQFLGFAKLETIDSKSRISNVIYTCPMHPEVRQTGPGSCPKCGMALEPEVPAAADEGPSAELIDMTRRFWVSLVLTVPVLALAMGEMLAPELVEGLSVTARLWMQLALAAPVVLWGGWPFFVR